MEFQLRRSCILKPQHEPKIDQEIDMKPPSTSDFRLSRSSAKKFGAILRSVVCDEGSQPNDSRITSLTPTKAIISRWTPRPSPTPFIATPNPASPNSRFSSVL